MKTFFSLLLITAFLTSCSVKPEPLNYGKDFCHSCKMTLMDHKFGSEIVTKKGKVYKFDDVNCMIGFCKSGSEPEDNVAHYLIVDFSRPGELIDAKTARYIRSDAVRSPMASQVAAFSPTENLDSRMKEWNGQVMTWDELFNQFQ